MSDSGPPLLNWVYALSRTGPSHIRTGKPCQDASATWGSDVDGRCCLVAAVADGHGDDRHDQSQHGSRLAVQAAIEDLVDFYGMCFESGLNAQSVATFKSDFPRQLVRRWRERVERDAESRLGPVDNSGSHPLPTVIARYGTTLLVALAYDGVAVLGQIGDGVIGVINADGTVEFPLAVDSEDVGGVTDSLSSSEAHLRWRTAAVDVRDGRAIVLCTDGIVNSLPDEEHLRRFLCDIQGFIVEHGLPKVQSWFPQWLNSRAIATGDDASLAIITLAPVCSGGGNAASTDGTSVHAPNSGLLDIGDANDVDKDRPVIDGGDSRSPAHGEEETG